MGDPQQLPPTVLSQRAIENKYDVSLFQRLMKASPHSISLLSIQYRMHPQISNFPGKRFYGARIQDAANMEQLRTIEWHAHPQGYFQPYYFFNAHKGWESKTAKQSLYNQEEVDICVRLVRNLAESCPKIKFGHRIGIISFYKEQVYRLKSRFRAEFGRDYNKSIDINTVIERFIIGRWIPRSRKRYYNFKLCSSFR